MPVLAGNRRAQYSVDDGTPAGNGGEIIVTWLPHGVAEKGVLPNLAGAVPQQRVVDVREFVTQDRPTASEQVVRLPELPDRRTIPCVEDLIR